MKRLLLFLLVLSVSSQAYYQASVATNGICSTTMPGTFTGRDTWVNGVQNSTTNNFTQVNYGANTNMSCGSTINTTLAVFNHNCIVAFNMTCFAGLKFVNVTLVAYQTSNSSEGRVGLQNGTNLSVNWVNTPNNWTERNATWYNNTNASYWLYAGGMNLIGARTSSNVTMVNNSRQYYAWNFSNITWWNLQPDRINGNLTSLTTSYALSTIIANTTTYKWFATKETIAINQAPYLNVTIDEPPFVVTLGENTTTPEPTDWIMLNGTLADDINISGYILSVDNCSGSLSNSSWTAFAGANATNASTKIQIPASCEGQPFQWTYYLNDSQNQWNNAVAHVILVQNVKPVLSDDNVNQSVANHDSSVCFNITATDKGVGLDGVFAHIQFPNGSVVEDIQLTNTSVKDGCGGSGSTFSVIVGVGTDLSPPDLNVLHFHANDTLGNEITYPSTLTVTVIDPYPLNITRVAVNTTTTLKQTEICFNATVIDVHPGHISSVWRTATFPNGTILNITEQNASSIGTCGGSGQNYSQRLSVGDTCGTLALQTTWANDTSGNYGQNTTINSVSITGCPTAEEADRTRRLYSTPDEERKNPYIYGDYIPGSNIWVLLAACGLVITLAYLAIKDDKRRGK